MSDTWILHCAPKESGESLGIAVPRPSSTGGSSAAETQLSGAVLSMAVCQDAGYDLVTVTPTGIEAWEKNTATFLKFFHVFPCTFEDLRIGRRALMSHLYSLLASLSL